MTAPDAFTEAETIAELRAMLEERDAEIRALSELNAGLRAALRRAEDEFARHFMAAARAVWEQSAAAGGPIKIHFKDQCDQAPLGASSAPQAGSEE